ncbi:TPA: hypothetical protein RG726_001234 [Morganella morganii subsp. morganii]|nr:hypothetical protein [Morganella morganii subsp. morganii]
MKDRIKFSDEMLAAVIDGRKTQTRRLIEPQPKVTEKRLRELDAWQDGYTLSEQVCTAWRHMGDDCPYGQAGDVIPFADKDGNIKGEIEIVDVWLQQVQEITLGDICKEVGCGLYDFIPVHYGFEVFADIWSSIYGRGSWLANPWVWVIEFKQIQEG